MDGCNAFSIAMENNHKAIGVLLYAHMNFGKQSSPKKWITSGSPSTRTIFNSSLNISSSHASAFTPVSKSLTQDAPPPPPSSEDPPKHPSRSRSLSPTSRQSSLLSSRKSKYQNPPKGSHSTATGGPSNPSKSSVAGNSNDFGQSASKPTTPQNNFQRNTPLRRSGPARSKQAESSGIVSALRRSGDPQSKNQSV
ncbi:putative KN motif and ankyrin repeat domain-containing protein 1 [Apostichopus japonicus]|uniref:Putative KN motif and ankyrin repeat domain-containing protein 1 n=1 Tax=Stichopus japonicus TaxID=307972 RepID=A0A2G8K780_STIJA|nr:putative KN motif and ankyrin repeat domain-containing protein 1 [Apostichopus japonicus]